VTHTVIVRPPFVARAGLACVAGAAIAVAGELVLALVPQAVGSDRLSHPLTPQGYRVLQGSLTLGRILLIVGVLGIARAGAAGAGWGARAGLGLTVAGLALLTGCEAGAFLLADSARDTARTSLLQTMYGLATLMIGVGLTITGVAVRRARRWTGWARHVVFAAGLAVPVVVIPAIAGPQPLGRIALIGWMLMWAALGIALVGSARTARGPA
jgi:hypothetical protein